VGISFGHQVANDAKAGSGTTGKSRNLRKLAGEPGFSHDFNGLDKLPSNSLYFPAASDRGCHLCALALGISQQEGIAAIISALAKKVTVPWDGRFAPTADIHVDRQ
jgi:hypothetical protein